MKYKLKWVCWINELDGYRAGDIVDINCENEPWLRDKKTGAGFFRSQLEDYEGKLSK